MDKQEIEATLGRRLLLGEMMARNARKFPDKEALIYGDARLTYRQLNARINRLAHALMDLGIKRGWRPTSHWARSEAWRYPSTSASTRRS